MNNFLFPPAFSSHAVRMEALAAEEIRRVVQLALAEDVGGGDITTLATVAPNATAKAVMIAREPLMVAGLAVAEAVFGELSPAIRISRTAKDGDHVTSGQSLLHISGPAQGGWSLLRLGPVPPTAPNSRWRRRFVRHHPSLRCRLWY